MLTRPLLIQPFGASIRHESGYTNSFHYLSSVSIMLHILATCEYPAAAWCSRSLGATIVCFAALIEVSNSSLSTSKCLHILLIFPRCRALTSVSTVALSLQALLFIFWNETIPCLPLFTICSNKSAIVGFSYSRGDGLGDSGSDFLDFCFLGGYSNLLMGFPRAVRSIAARLSIFHWLSTSPSSNPVDHRSSAAPHP
jgi:hypothetical protein